MDDSKFSRRKLKSIVKLITIFTLVISTIILAFTNLKQKLDSKSLSSNPDKAIRLVCYLTTDYYYSYYDNLVYYRELLHELDSLEASGHRVDSAGQSDLPLCINSITHLQNHSGNPSKTNPSKIFALSLLASLTHLEKTIPSAGESNCSEALTRSLTTVNVSLTGIGLNPGKNFLRDPENVNGIKESIKAAGREIDSCLKGPLNIKFKAFFKEAAMARRYVDISLMILENSDNILEMFYPSIGSLLGYFLPTFDFHGTLWFFCCCYLFIAALYVMVLRLHRQ